MSKSEAIDHLTAQIQRNQQIAGRVDQLDPELANALEQLQAWQRRRLAETYRDLANQPEYQLACAFFLDELYGGRDVQSRDHQLARVVPVMRRFLPGHLLHAVGEAMRLQAISLEFDLALADLMRQVSSIDQPAYAAAYRQHEAWSSRLEQIELIESLGRLLEQTVRKPMVRQLLKVMRRPAEMAGFGALHGFLERGMAAFGAMADTGYFLATISQRERAALEAMRAGDDWPFKPWIGQGPSGG